MKLYLLPPKGHIPATDRGLHFDSMSDMNSLVTIIFLGIFGRLYEGPGKEVLNQLTQLLHVCYGKSVEGPTAPLRDASA